MRILGLPVAILFLGFLAALPFRREPETKEVPERSSEGLALPQNVTPIVENNPARTRNDEVGISRRLEGGGVGMDDASQERSSRPYDLSLERLPKSYEEVAVPLVLDPRSPNLLVVPERVSTSQLPVQSIQKPVQSGRQIDRFGIPRTPASSAGTWGEGAGVANWRGSGADSLTSDWGWSSQQTIGKIASTADNSNVDSVAVNSENRSDQPMVEEAKPTFRMASEYAPSSAERSKAIAGESVGSSSNDNRGLAPNHLDYSPHSRSKALQPSQQTRPRHIIREPGL